MSTVGGRGMQQKELRHRRNQKVDYQAPGKAARCIKGQKERHPGLGGGTQGSERTHRDELLAYLHYEWGAPRWSGQQ
jgi:hypothetical protein